MNESTSLDKVQDLMQQFYGGIIMDDIKANSPLLSVIDRRYQGKIQEKGNSVKIQVLQEVKGQTKKTTSVGAAKFETNAAKFESFNVVADQVTYVPIKFDSLAALQSEVGDLVGQDVESTEAKLALGDGLVYKTIMNSLKSALETQVYALMKATVSNISDQTVDVLNLEKLSEFRNLTAKNHWGTTENKIALLSPEYMTNILTDNVLASDIYADKGLLVGDVKAVKRLGINFFEDDSEALAAMTDKTQGGVVFRQDAFNLVLQKAPTFKVYSNLPNNEDAVTVFAKVVWGINKGYKCTDKFFKLGPSA